MAIKAKSLQPRPVDTKSGWNHNSKTLAEIVTDMNDEDYVEDESEMMETIDKILLSLGKKYDITERRGKV